MLSSLPRINTLLQQVLSDTVFFLEEWMTRNGFGLQFVDSESNRKTFKDQRRPLVRLVEGTGPPEGFFLNSNVSISKQSSHLILAQLTYWKSLDAVILLHMLCWTLYVRLSHHNFEFHVQCPSWSTLEYLSHFPCPSVSLCIHLSLSPSIVLARWDDRDMHYSSVRPFCHCRAELWAEGCKAELQSINQGLTLTTMGYVDWMSQDIHANRKVLWAILYTLRLSGPFSH